MELEWIVTLRVEMGSWKWRHPVGLMLESGTWEGLGSNPHPTHKGKVGKIPNRTREMFVHTTKPPLVPRSFSLGTRTREALWRRSHQRSLVPIAFGNGHGTVLLKGSVGFLVFQTQNFLLCGRLGGGLERSHYFGKGNRAPWVIWNLPA